MKIEKFDKEKEKGASLVEYALLVALIAIIAIAALQLTGRTISTKFSDVAEGISEAGDEGLGALTTN